MACIPPTGSHTLIVAKVSPWYPDLHVKNWSPFLPRPRAHCSAIFIATSTPTEPESE